MKTRIYYHHTDAGSVVYYANYLMFLEEARTEFFEQRGVLIKELSDAGTMFVVVRQEIDYKYPAFYGDILEVKAQVSEVSGVRINFEHEIRNQNDRMIVKAKTIMVCVDKHLKPQAIPDPIRQKIS